MIFLDYFRKYRWILVNSSFVFWSNDKKSKYNYSVWEYWNRGCWVEGWE